MNAIAISVGSVTVYWSSLIIALGVLAGLVMGLSLCRDDKCRASAVLCFYPPAILFSVGQQDAFARHPLNLSV